jgi:hypothetical protein
MGGGGGGKPKPKKEESTYDPMMAYMAQMQSQQAAQAEAARKAQEAALIETQKQSALASAQQGELGAQQTLSQAGIMQQARDIAAKESQKRSLSAIGESAVGEGFDINQAKQQQMANIGGTGTMPSSAKLPFYGYNQNQDSGATGKYANIFNLPKTQGITFGGQ